MFGDDSSHGPNGTPKVLTLWGVLTSIILSEHLYFISRLIVRTALSKIEPPGMIMERRERFLVRRRYLEENMAGENEKAERAVHSGDEDLDGGDVKNERERRFWLEQSNPNGTMMVGKEIIRRSGEKKNQ